MATVILINQTMSIMDLSALHDVKGYHVVLQPKGMKGCERECPDTVLKHPHVITFINTKPEPWLTVRHPAIDYPPGNKLMRSDTKGPKKK